MPEPSSSCSSCRYWTPPAACGECAHSGEGWLPSESCSRWQRCEPEAAEYDDTGLELAWSVDAAADDLVEVLGVPGTLRAAVRAAIDAAYSEGRSSVVGDLGDDED